MTCGRTPVVLAEDALAGPAEGEEARLLGPGVLAFACAAHGRAGSAPLRFRGLGRAIMLLLAFGEEATTEVRFARLVRR